MKKPIKYAIIGVIALASIVGGVVFMLQPTPVRMTEMRRQTAELSFTEQGVVVAESSMLVFPATQGELRGLWVREGQTVSAGDPILGVDTTALELQLLQVQSGIRGLQAQLDNVEIEAANVRRQLETTRTSLQGELRAINAQAAEAYRGFASHQEAIAEQLRVQEILIEQHERDLLLAAENFSRITLLYHGGILPHVDYEAAGAAVVAAETRLEAARAQLAVIAAGTIANSDEHFEGIRESLEAQIDGIGRQLAHDTTAAARANFEALIAVEQANEARIEFELDNAVVFAPIGGIITTLHAQNTNQIAPASPVAEIKAWDNKLIDVYVSTQDISSINTGDTVGLTLRQRAGDAHFYGRISEIGDTAVVRFTALGVEERKVNVRISPDPPDGVNFGIGYGIDVTFYIFREENQLTVPRTAIFRQNGAYYVWVSEGGETGTARARQITLGPELRTETIIESGLSEGEFIINDANNDSLSEGARVTRE